MYWPKGCQRCGGDLALNWEERWSYVACLGCGDVSVRQDQLAWLGFAGAEAQHDQPRAA